MSTESATIVQRLWNYCNVLRDDGVSYGDYVEQLTYLLFLKMDQEQVDLWRQPSAIPAAYNWASLRNLEGAELERHYLTLLTELGKGSGLIPVIFRKAQNRIQDPAKLRRLITLIDDETWTGMDIDVKGEIYEGLLEKNAHTNTHFKASVSSYNAYLVEYPQYAETDQIKSSLLPAANAGFAFPEISTE
jgi:type I restriction enzyme M protein